jgi:GTPase
MSLRIAIIGRPNVGKSTLYNRLVGRKSAIVEDTPGVTRDWQEEEGRIGDYAFNIMDTAGLEDAKGTHLEGRMTQKTLMAAQKADVILFMVDAQTGLLPDDHHYADWARRISKPIVLIVNKSESRKTDAGYLEAYGLGLGEPLAISAEHGEGMIDLFDRLKEFEREPVEESTTERRMQLAIVGRPNVGKSTLINELIGEDRLLTGPEAGITRDAIGLDWEYGGRPIKLIDTAGLRKKARVKERLEALSSKDTLQAIQYAEMVVLVIDGREPLEKQELTIARHVVEEGRGLIIAVNKWDSMDDKQKCLNQISDTLQTSLTQVRGISVIPISALYHKHFDRLFEAVFSLYDEWNKRLGTSEINRWLAVMLENHSPPMVSGRRIKIRYMTQIKSRPPTFSLFVSSMDLPISYQRYLVNGLRKDLGFGDGVPIRLQLRKGKNPYVKN